MNPFEKQNEANLNVFLSCQVRGKGGRDQVEVKAGRDSREEFRGEWMPMGTTGQEWNGPPCQVGFFGSPK